jgi:large subunit ribosomal protein L3
MEGLIGRKCGMTRIFTEQGQAIPVTVIEALPHYITQLKNADVDGYTAIQVTTGQKKRSHVNKAKAGHFAKANVEPGLGLWEFRVSDGILNKYKLGDAYHLDIFKEGQEVDVTGITKGAGFAGTVKRYHFRTQDMTHGNSRSHRVPGSTGQNQTPGRVFKGKKMCGHLGVVNRTMQSLQVIKLDKERNLIAVKGSVPGADESLIIITSATKAKRGA